MESLCHRGVATSRNATCSSPEQRHPTTPRADDRRRRRPPRVRPAPSPLSLLPPHYSHALLPSSSAPREEPVRPPRGGGRPADAGLRSAAGKPLVATTRRRMEAAAAAPAPAADRDPAAEHHHGCLAVRTSLPRCALGTGSGGGSSLPGSSGEFNAS